jgi:hypothetical protein
MAALEPRACAEKRERPVPARFPYRASTSGAGAPQVLRLAHLALLRDRMQLHRSFPAGHPVAGGVARVTRFPKCRRCQTRGLCLKYMSSATNFRPLTPVKAPPLPVPDLRFYSEIRSSRAVETVGIVGAQWELPGGSGAWKPRSHHRFLSQSGPVDGHSGRTGAFHALFSRRQDGPQFPLRPYMGRHFRGEHPPQ